MYAYESLHIRTCIYIYIYLFIYLFIWAFHEEPREDPPALPGLRRSAARLLLKDNLKEINK